MFRDLARMTASLKGPCYEGALIARAVWERGGGWCRERDAHPARPSWTAGGRGI